MGDHYHDDVIKWKHFPRNWPFVRGIHRSPVNSPHKGQWCGALMFSLICVLINDWVNNRGAGDLRRHRGHCDVIVMSFHSNGNNQHSFELTRWPRYVGCVWGCVIKALRRDGIKWSIFMNENCCILIEMSLKIVPNGPIKNIPALVQIMPWRRSGGKPLPESMMA